MIGEPVLAGIVLDLAVQFVVAALTAWSNASGQPITADAIAALMPDPGTLMELDQR